MARTYHVVTLGCPKNDVDSEHLERMLTGGDLIQVPMYQDADAIVVIPAASSSRARRNRWRPSVNSRRPSVTDRRSSSRAAAAARSAKSTRTSTTFSASASGRTWRGS